MCSTREARLARISAAIEEVATAARRGGQADMTELADRVAEIWTMVADLDPTLAARLHTYYPDAH